MAIPIEPQNGDHVNGEAEYSAHLEKDFTKVPDQIFKHGFKPFQIAVLVCLLQHGKAKDSFPSYRTISAECRMSRYQAIRTVKSLESYITIVSRPYQVNTFHVELSRLVNDVDQSMTLTSQRGRLPQSMTLTTLVNDVDPELEESKEKNRTRGISLSKGSSDFSLNGENQETGDTEATKNDYESFVAALRLEFADLADFDTHVRNCQQWRKDHHKPSTGDKSALRTWLTKERQSQKEHNGRSLKKPSPFTDTDTRNKFANVAEEC